MSAITESKPIPRTDADAVSLDLVWAAAYAVAFARLKGPYAAENAANAADFAVAGLVKFRARALPGVQRGAF